MPPQRRGSGSHACPGSRHGRWWSRPETKASRQPHGLTPWSPNHPTDGVTSPEIIDAQKLATKPVAGPSVAADKAVVAVCHFASVPFHAYVPALVTIPPQCYAQLL